VLTPQAPSPLQGPPRLSSGGGLLGEGFGGGWFQGPEAGFVMTRPRRSSSSPRATRPAVEAFEPIPPHEAAQLALQGLHPSAARASRQQQGPPLQRQRTMERPPLTSMDEARGLSSAAGLAQVSSVAIMTKRDVEKMFWRGKKQSGMLASRLVLSVSALPGVSACPCNPLTLDCLDGL
jgi:hypothetical protein